MNRYFQCIIVSLTLIAFSVGTGAAQDPDPPEPQPMNLINPIVRVLVLYEESTDTFEYHYTLQSGAESLQPINSLAIATSLEEKVISNPPDWFGSFDPASANGGSFPDRIQWIHGEAEGVSPGAALSGFQFQIQALPAVTEALCTGWVPPVSYDVVPRFSSAPKPIPLDQRYKAVDSIGPGLDLKENHTLLEILDFMLQEHDKAVGLSWISSSAVLRPAFENLKTEISSENFAQARMTLNEILEDLEGYKGLELTNDGYFLLKPSLEYVKFRLEAPPEPITLNLTLHSKHVMPHRSQRVELEVTPSAQADLVFTLYRVANRNLPNELGEPVYSQTATGVSSSYLFTWEGQTITGEPAHNGNYELTVTAGDFSQSVSVQVNRQQGKQSWLKLSTQGLAFLGRPTLLGSLTFAALPGVTWLAVLTEEREGEKVAFEAVGGETAGTTFQWKHLWWSS